MCSCHQAVVTTCHVPFSSSKPMSPTRTRGSTTNSCFSPRSATLFPQQYASASHERDLVFTAYLGDPTGSKVHIPVPHFPASDKNSVPSRSTRFGPSRFLSQAIRVSSRQFLDSVLSLEGSGRKHPSYRIFRTRTTTSMTTTAASRRQRRLRHANDDDEAFPHKKVFWSQSLCVNSRFGHIISSFEVIDLSLKPVCQTTSGRATTTTIPNSISRNIYIPLCCRASVLRSGQEALDVASDDPPDEALSGRRRAPRAWDVLCSRGSKLKLQS